MTDNRTTELREKLDALGIEHTDASYKRKAPITAWHSNGATFCFVESSNQIDLHVENPTPEQTIAATLGSDNEYEAKMDALLCRLTNGKWSKSRAYSLDFMVSCVDEEYETLYAKELAELGSGTCELAYGEDDEGYDGWYCQSCGGWFDAVRRDGKLVEPRRCGCCGKAVER